MQNGMMDPQQDEEPGCGTPDEDNAWSLGKAPEEDQQLEQEGFEGLGIVR